MVAELDADGTVLRVIVVDDPDPEAFAAALLGGGPWKAITPARKNYPGPGWRFDAGRNAFIGPQPRADWTFNESTCQWEPPKGPSK